jgi:hypothetical protein
LWLLQHVPDGAVSCMCGSLKAVQVCCQGSAKGLTLWLWEGNLPPWPAAAAAAVSCSIHPFLEHQLMRSPIPSPRATTSTALGVEPPPVQRALHRTPRSRGTAAPWSPGATEKRPTLPSPLCVRAHAHSQARRTQLTPQHAATCPPVVHPRQHLAPPALLPLFRPTST